MIYPAKRLQEVGFEVIGLFFNPNIHPYSEYKLRRDAVIDYAKKIGIEMLVPDYAPEEFFRAVNMLEERIERCPICWHQRLETTAQLAREKEIISFTTTLLVSPYQDQELLQRIGSDVAGEEDAEFYYEDFRPGFRAAHDEAKKDGIYCQKYCGCIYSEIERYKKNNNKQEQ